MEQRRLRGTCIFCGLSSPFFISYRTFLHISLFTPELNGDFKPVWAPWRYKHIYFYLMEWFAHNVPAIIHFKSILAACNCCKTQCNITYAQYCDCMFFPHSFFLSPWKCVEGTAEQLLCVSRLHKSLHRCDGMGIWESSPVEMTCQSVHTSVLKVQWRHIDSAIPKCPCWLAARQRETWC